MSVAELAVVLRRLAPRLVALLSTYQCEVTYAPLQHSAFDRVGCWYSKTEALRLAIPQSRSIRWLPPPLFGFADTES
jgi:hypothetical protein